MTVTNPYETLGVKKNSRLETIKKRYRKLVRDCHPDANPEALDAHDRFLAIQAAFECLVDPAKRAAFDRDGVMPHPVSDSQRSHALNAIGATLQGFMQAEFNAGRDPECFDYLKALRGKLEEVVAKCAADIAKAEKMIAQAEATAKRFTNSKGEENIMAAMARAPIEAMAQHIKQMQESQAIHRLAITIIEGYGFDKKSGAVQMATVFVQGSPLHFQYTGQRPT